MQNHFLALSTTSSTTTTTTTPSPTPTSTTTTQSTTSSPVVITTTSSSISYSTNTETITSVVPTTSDGTTAYTTLTSVVVATSPATTVVDVGTTTSTPGSTPSIAAANSGSSSSSSGLSTGAKAGIGVGVGIAVVGAALFGWWYAWYMRRRRNRNSLAHDHYDANGPIPGMSEYGGSATGGRSGMGAMAAVAGYSSNRSDNTRSELASPPLQPPPRSPDRLLPAAAGIRSWGSVSPPPQQGSSGRSVSDASEYSQNHASYPQQQQEPGRMSAAAAGYFSDANELPGGQPQSQPEQSHQRHLSGDSGPVSAQSQAYSQDEGFYPNASAGQNPYELPGGQDAGQNNYRGVDPEVPLHQRYDRVPVRPGHLGPSHNF
ncbi:hypothetical protein LTS17_011476 [Exophiala oligosperma]